MKNNNLLVTGDMAALLHDERVRAVAVVVPARFHAAVVEAVLKAKKHVLVEKPFTLELAEAEALESEAKKADRALMVGHLLNHHPAFNELVRLVELGRIGAVSAVHSRRMMLGQFREEDVLWSLASHDVSMILRVAGRNLAPTAVQCVANGTVSLTRRGVYDFANISMQWADSGIVASCTTSWVSVEKKAEITVIGTKGVLKFDDCKPWAEKLQVFDNFCEWRDGQPVAVKRTDFAPTSIAVPETQPLTAECSAFCETVEARDAGKGATASESLSDAAEALRVMRTLVGAHQSAEKGGASIQLASIGNQQRFFAHETALVDDPSVVGAGTKIWHFSHIMPGCAVGEQCNIGQNVVVHANAALGARCKVQNNVSVYGGVVCGDDCFLGPSMVFTNVRRPRAAVNRHGEWDKTVVGASVTIGANATIVCGIRIGNFAFIGAGTVVTKDVPSFALMVGNPAKQIGWVDCDGERLDFGGASGQIERNGKRYCLSSDGIVSMD